MSTENIICMKWGNRYSADYVNRLAGMVHRNLSIPHRFICFTEDSSGIHSSVEIRPLPELKLDEHLPERGWRKLTVFQDTLADVSGRALFLDLDVVILGSLDPFFQIEGAFRIIKDWNLRHTFIGNSSVFRFEIGKYSDVLSYFIRHGEEVRAQHRNEQAYLSWFMRERGVLDYWPEEWCISFKRHCLRVFPLGYFMNPKRPSSDAKIVVFHGKPNPDEVCSGWHSRSYLRAVRPTAWVEEEWRE